MELINKAKPSIAPSMVKSSMMTTNLATHYDTSQFGGLSSENRQNRTGVKFDADSSIHRQSICSAEAASRYAGHYIITSNRELNFST